MREKLMIANQMRKLRKVYSNNPKDKRLCSKCYYTYIIECIIKGKENFKISFGGKYVTSFPNRIYNYYRYILESIYRFFLMHFAPNNDNTPLKYRLIHYGVSKPVHCKIAEMPNEVMLYGFLKVNGFKITGEHLYSDSTVYDVAKA